MGGREWWRRHPYFLATGIWPPPGYGNRRISSSNESATQDPEDAELDDKDEGNEGSNDNETANEATPATAAADRDRPGRDSRRTMDISPTPMTTVKEPSRSGEAEGDNSHPPDADAEKPENQDLATALKQRSERMFLRTGEDPIESGSLAVASEALNDSLVVAVRTAIRALYTTRRADICRSPERPDLQLSQEEAMGYLLADALGRPLLAARARRWYACRTRRGTARRVSGGEWRA